MGKLDKQLHVRMSARELERARQLAGALDMSVSDLVRVLIQLPPDYVNHPENTEGRHGASRAVIVLDRTAAAKIHGEARRWGYHYNQAVHALNRIAYYLRLGEADVQDVEDELERVSLEVDALMSEVAPMRRRMEELASRRMAFL